MVEKSQFYILREFIPEISNEKEYGVYNNIELEDQFLHIFFKQQTFFSLLNRKAKIKVTKLKMRITSHRIFFEIEKAKFCFLINCENITRLKGHVYDFFCFI